MNERLLPSELIINPDGSCFHLEKIILVGDPGRVAVVASHFSEVECEVSNREFKTVTGTYKGKRLSVISTGIGCDNIDIVINEIDALANIDFETRQINSLFGNSTNRYMWWLAARNSRGNLCGQRQEYWLRWIVEFLRRTR